MVMQVSFMLRTIPPQVLNFDVLITSDDLKRPYKSFSHILSFSLSFFPTSFEGINPSHLISYIIKINTIKFADVTPEWRTLALR